ncbi:VrrA/YqfQ family protein [Virgibacillus alimentarius]|uniref:YqfQ-like protein n=1 Tax=Virgibacillus alimentarius TaxID=698769 RepID=A0ABS4S4B0_9BACI|nr:MULTISPECIES: VrrA/YqfQ family protein [Virgibacillus]MBP2256323.1 hypothetical protein [Virgibacillus alimentarius]HLR66269.1 VrrA/YqfQ family protein [Virgibacillus sp.]
MVYPMQGPRNYHSNAIHTIPPNPGLNRMPNRNHIQNKMQPLMQKGVGGLSKTLNNVQQVLGVVQSTAPIVQQYGPMVKNLPAMYRMLKAFKEVEDSESIEAESLESLEDNKEIMESSNKVTNDQTTYRKEKGYPNQQKRISGESTPKLFI